MGALRCYHHGKPPDFRKDVRGFFFARSQLDAAWTAERRLWGPGGSPYPVIDFGSAICGSTSTRLRPAFFAR
jgi:hypothetical protein